MADVVVTADHNQQGLLTAALDVSSTSNDLQKEQEENVSAVDNRSFTSDELEAQIPTQYTGDGEMGDSKTMGTPPSDSQAMGPNGDFKRSPRDRAGTDAQSALSGSSKGDSVNSSRPTSAASSRSPLHKERDPAKRAKDREREERVRQTRERMAEERRKKFEELKEQQRQAQENREKQLEMRRRKIAELRQREDERRAQVEERRKRKEANERARREEIINRAHERVARYEQWKLGGRKGASGHVFGFGSRAPRDICQPFERPKRSSSHSALIRRSPNGSDSDYARPQRRALSACSTVRRHCCIDINRTTAPSAPPPQRPQSTVGLNSVRLRDQKPRKPRPASIASSMPSFMQADSQKASPRSKSTDRLSRDKPNRTPRKSLGNHQDKKKEEEPKESNGDADKKNSQKISRRSIDRLSQPKKIREKPELEVKIDTTPTTKKSPRSRISPRKSLSTTNLATVARKPTKSILKDKAKEAPAGPAQVVLEDESAAMSRSAHEAMSKSVMDIATKANTDLMSKSMDMSAMSKSTQDITVEEYKAKLAEKRRQAREKAEREAELEREKQEAERLAEEERKRAEEEEQRRQEEEALKLAAEARAAEEERLQKAIEAEEARKKEEAERLENERIAKEEADERAREEAEKQEKERQERMKKEEEERLERKKRLEMIMKRVKTDGSESPKTQSPAKSATSSPSKSGDSSTESSTDDATEETMTTTVTKTGSVTNIVTTITSEETSRPDSGPSSPRGASPVPSTPNEKSDKADAGDTPKFRSPLLQQLVENKSSSGATERPKFKSPLLQNLLGKNKLSSRGNEEKGEDKKVEDSPVVNGKEGSDSVINSMCDTDTNSVKEKLKYDEASDEDKDVDTSEKSDGRRDSVDTTEDLPVDKAVRDSAEESVGDMQENKAVLQSATDSGILMDLGSSSTSLVPGPVNGLPHNGDARDLVDSSISMKSVESVTTSVTDGGLTESELISSQNDFEEIIDLSVTNSNKNIQRNFESRGENSEDLLNFNNLEGAGEDTNRTPLIAFEENSTTRQDVTDLLS